MLYKHLYVACARSGRANRVYTEKPQSAGSPTVLQLPPPCASHQARRCRCLSR